MSQLRFNAQDVQRVCRHTLSAPQQMKQVVGYHPTASNASEPITVPPSAASVLLVHDNGIYLMSNGTPRDIISGDEHTGRSFCAYAEGCNPDIDEDWWDTSRALVGGDDFGDTLPWAQDMLNLIQEGYSTIVITFTPKKLTLSGRNKIPLPQATQSSQIPSTRTSERQPS